MRTRFYLVQGKLSEQEGMSGIDTDPWPVMERADWVLLRTDLRGGELVTEVPVWLSHSTAEWDATCRKSSHDSSNTVEVSEVIALLGMRLGVTIAVDSEEAGTAAVAVIHDFIYHHRWNYTMFMVVSSNTRALARVRRLDHHIKRALDVDMTPQHASALGMAVDAYAVHVHLSRIDSAIVDECHRAGLMVFATDVSDISHMDTVVRLGVDGFASDYPERVRRWRELFVPDRGDRVPDGLTNAAFAESPAP